MKLSNGKNDDAKVLLFLVTYTALSPTLTRSSFSITICLPFHILAPSHPLLSFSEICSGCPSRAAVRDGVSIFERGRGTHLRVWGRDDGWRRAEDHPAAHQTSRQHVSGGCWVLHQQTEGQACFNLLV